VRLEGEAREVIDFQFHKDRTSRFLRGYPVCAVMIDEAARIRDRKITDRFLDRVLKPGAKPEPGPVRRIWRRGIAAMTSITWYGKPKADRNDRNVKVSIPTFQPINSREKLLTDVEARAWLRSGKIPE
jgi:hypothetical protein